MSISDELYQQVILDYNKQPRNFRRIENPTHMARGLNPLCGDDYTVYLVVDGDGTIQDASFEGQGCAISKASASMMTVALKGQKEERARALFQDFHELVTGKKPPEACDLGKLSVFSGVWRYPARVKCAALCWHAMKSALEGEEAVSTEDKM